MENDALVQFLKKKVQETGKKSSVILKEQLKQNNERVTFVKCKLHEYSKRYSKVKKIKLLFSPWRIDDFYAKAKSIK